MRSSYHVVDCFHIRVCLARFLGDYRCCVARSLHSFGLISVMPSTWVPHPNCCCMLSFHYSTDPALITDPNLMPDPTPNCLPFGSLHSIFVRQSSIGLVQA